MHGGLAGLDPGRDDRDNGSRARRPVIYSNSPEKSKKTMSLSYFRASTDMADSPLMAGTSRPGGLR